MLLPGRWLVESRELLHLDKLAHLICNELHSYHRHWNKNILDSYKYNLNSKQMEQFTIEVEKENLESSQRLYL